MTKYEIIQEVNSVLHLAVLAPCPESYTKAVKDVVERINNLPVPTGGSAK